MIAIYPPRYTLPPFQAMESFPTRPVNSRLSFALISGRGDLIISRHKAEQCRHRLLSGLPLFTATHLTFPQSRQAAAIYLCWPVSPSSRALLISPISILIYYHNCSKVSMPYCPLYYLSSMPVDSPMTNYTPYLAV